MNVNINQTIAYDENIILKIKEMIKTGLDKLKYIIESKSLNLEFFNDLKSKFTEISLKLNELKLWNELNYFNSISPYIEYIVYQNSINSSFGHCSFAIELLKFYLDFIKNNFDFYLKTNNMSLEEFESFQEEIKRKYRLYRRKFYGEVYELSGDYTEEELYKIHESLRE